MNLLGFEKPGHPARLDIDVRRGPELDRRLGRLRRQD